MHWKQHKKHVLQTQKSKTDRTQTHFYQNRKYWTVDEVYQVAQSENLSIICTQYKKNDVSTCRKMLLFFFSLNPIWGKCMSLFLHTQWLRQGSFFYVVLFSNQFSLSSSWDYHFKNYLSSNRLKNISYQNQHMKSVCNV